MASLPPPEPPRPVVPADLDALEERIEIYLSVFVDERIHLAESRMLAALDRHAETLAATTACRLRTDGRS